MNDLTCPFCHSRVPWGAVVCTGCHAVVKYKPVEKDFEGFSNAGMFLGALVAGGWWWLFGLPNPWWWLLVIGGSIAIGITIMLYRTVYARYKLGPVFVR